MIMLCDSTFVFYIIEETNALQIIFGYALNIQRIKHVYIHAF